MRLARLFQENGNTGGGRTWSKLVTNEEMSKLYMAVWPVISQDGWMAAPNSMGVVAISFGRELLGQILTMAGLDNGGRCDDLPNLSTIPGVTFGPTSNPNNTHKK